MMTKDYFENYLALFNDRKYDEFPIYYAEDIEYVMDAASGKIYRGRQAIVDLYRELHQYFDESVSIVNFAQSRTLFAMEAYALMRAKKPFDMEGFIPIPAGQVLEMTSFNHYDLNVDGKISRIRLGIQSMRYIPDDGKLLPRTEA